MLILLFFSCGLLGQNVKKGFKHIDKGEFESAIVVFNEIIRNNSNSVIGNYGLSLVYSSLVYRGTDYFKSYKHVKNAEDYFIKLTSEKKKEISDYVTSSLIQKQKDIVEESLFNIVKTDDSSNLIDKFLNDCKDSKYYKNVVDIRNNIEFQRAKEYHSISVYENFIKKYPNSKEAPQAKANIIEMVFADVKEKNTINDYESFIEKYPESNEAKFAKEFKLKLEYEFAIKINSIDTYNDFIEQYPVANQLAEIIELRNQKAYSNAIRANSIDTYNRFAELYPKSGQLEKIILKRDSLAFQQAKTKNTYQSYEVFIQSYPEAKQKNDAKKLQELLQENKVRKKLLEEKQYIKINKLKSCVGYKYNYVSGSPVGPKVKVFEKLFDSTGCITQFYDNNFNKNQTEKYLYDHNANVIEKHLVQQESIIFKVFFKFDEQGSISDEETKCIDKDFIGCTNQTIKYFNKTNGVVQESFCTGNSGDTIMKTKYQYDDSGRLVNEIIYKKNELAGYLISKITYMYDLSGNLTQKLTYNASKTIESVESYKFDTSDNLIEKITYNALGEKRITYKYNAKGFLIEETNWDNKTNDANYLIEYLYNFY